MKHVVTALWLCAAFPAASQLIDQTKAPNTIHEGIAKSLEDEIGAGKHLGVHVVRNHLRDGAIAMTREVPVHIRSINGRGPAPREKCGKVETRHDDQAPQT